MAVCSFFLRGACKFGNNCHNEHPQDAVNKRAPFGSTSSSWTPASTASQKTIPYSLETMTKDFDNAYDKPLWPLSTYGPAKHEPNLLPPLDESFEELRLKAVTAAKSGTINEYIKYEQEKTANAEQIFANVRRDMKGAFEAAKKQTFTAEGAAGPSTSSGSAFGGGTTSALGGGSAFGGSGSAFGGSNNGASAFGKPSTFGALPNSTATSAFGSALPTGQSAFGQPAFGRPAAPTSAFGQPAFGQPSQPATSAFGQSAQPSTSAFGQSAQQPTSAFGQTSQPTSAFGQSSVFKPATAFGSTGGTSAFGGGASSGGNAGGGFAAFASGGPSAFSTAASSAPSSSGPVFGQSAFGGGGSLGQTGSVFGNGQPAQGSTTSAFGQTGALGQQQQPTSAFGQAAPATSAFGPAQPATSAFGSTPAQATMSAFGQSASATPTSAFGQSAPATSAFGHSAPTTSAFGQSTPATSAFGQSAPSTSAFGQSTPATSAFGQASAAFGQPTSAFAQAAPTASPFGGSSSAFGGSPSAFGGSPSAFGGTPIAPKSAFGDGGGFAGAAPAPKIKSGVPDFENAKSTYKPGLDQYDALLPPNYSELLPPGVKAAFAEKWFQWGNVPDWIPPMEMR